MKNSILFFLAALLLNSLISCMPQDREVVSKEKRDQILSQRGGGRTDPNQVKLGSYGLGAFLVEKQGEILQLLALSTVNSGETRGGFTLNESTSRTGEVRHLNLDADGVSVSHREFVTTQSANWDLLLETLPSNQSSSSLTLAFDGSVKNSRLELKNSASGNDFQGVILEEYIAKLSALPLATESALSQVSYQSSGFLTLNKAGVKEVIPFTLQLDFQIDLGQLKASSLKIVGTKALLRLARKYPMDVKLASSGELSFVNDPLCPRMLGTALLDPDKTKKTLVFSETGVSVSGTKYTAPNADCGARPLIDLSRILIY